MAQVQATRPERRESTPEAAPDPPPRRRWRSRWGPPPRISRHLQRQGGVHRAARDEAGGRPPLKWVVIDHAAPPARAEAAAAGGQLAAPEALALRSNPQVQSLANSSPDRAAAGRANTPHRRRTQSAPSTFLSGVEMVDPRAVQQAEKTETPAQHEDEADAVRKDKDPRDPKVAGRVASFSRSRDSPGSSSAGDWLLALRWAGPAAWPSAVPTSSRP